MGGMFRHDHGDDYKMSICPMMCMYNYRDENGL